MNKYFTPFQSMDGYYIVGFDAGDIFHGLKLDFRSSYHVLGARLLGMTYGDFMLYFAKNFNGQIHGKKGYSHLGFKDRHDCQKLCDLLEKQWKRVIKDTDLEKWVANITQAY